MARLVQNRIQRHWFIEQMSEAELTEVQSVAEQAVALAPNLAQVHVALGQFYYYGYRQYEPALAEFGRALQLQPTTRPGAGVFGLRLSPAGAMATLFGRRSRESLEQDPRNAEVAANFANTYCIADVERSRAHRQVCARN